MPTTRRTSTGRKTSTTRKTNRSPFGGQTTGRTTAGTSTTRRTAGRKGTTSRTTGKTSTTRRTTGKSTTKTTGSSQQSWSPAQFTPVRRDIQSKVGSFRNIQSQVSGPGKVTAFSPRTASQWTNYVAQGTNVYKFSNQQIKRTFGSKFSTNTPTATVSRWFKQKFGAGIKGVARGRGSSWLVAASSNVNKGPFRNYTWK